MTKELLTTDQTYDHLRQGIRHLLPESAVPDFELRYKAGLIADINRLAALTNTVILKHNYMEPVLFYGVDGYKGDSLELSRIAAETTADRIIFCGVHFMAESAKILNPNKIVLIPSLEAGCSLADGIKPDDVVWLKQQFPGLPVITYINSTAAVKAETDYCCTSGNFQKVIEQARKDSGQKSVIFIPDKYMAGNIANDLKMKLYIPNKGPLPQELVDYQNEPYIIGWNARCYVHEQYTRAHVDAIRKDFPGAIVVAHPECPPEVISAADFSGSTSKMVKFVEENGANKRIALLTECSMADNIVARRPEFMDSLIRMCNLRCKFMHLITVEQLHDALVKNQYQVAVPEEIRLRAEKSIRRMLEIK